MAYKRQFNAVSRLPSNRSLISSDIAAILLALYRVSLAGSKAQQLPTMNHNSGSSPQGPDPQFSSSLFKFQERDSSATATHRVVNPMAATPLSTNTLINTQPLRPPPPPFEKPKSLDRASRVPVGRLERMLEFTSLGLSLAGNLATKNLKRSSSLSSSSNLLTPETADKIVAKLSKMRGAALKLGQMLSIQDTEEMKEVAGIFKRVQANADYMPEWQLEQVLEDEWGSNWMQDKFSEFDSVPFAAASIGQVHFARLKNTNDKVAVKIQYPGIERSISSDLDNLYMLLSISALLPKGLYLDNTIKVARKELAVECDYVHELEAMEKFRSLLVDSKLDSVFTIPKVYKEHSSRRILVSEFVEGHSIDKCDSLSQSERDLVRYYFFENKTNLNLLFISQYS